MNLSQKLKKERSANATGVQALGSVPSAGGRTKGLQNASLAHLVYQFVVTPSPKGMKELHSFPDKV